MSYGGDRTNDDCPLCGVAGVRCSHNGHSSLKKCDNPKCSTHQFWSLPEEAAQ